MLKQKVTVMQSARIWFLTAQHSIGLADVNRLLVGLGAEVHETEWRFEDTVIAQLQVIRPVLCLIQLGNPEWVLEEAIDFATRAPADVRDRLAHCDMRLEIGDADAVGIKTDEGYSVAMGWTAFDPAHPEAKALLQGVTRALDGVFEDNVNGLWWQA